MKSKVFFINNCEKESVLKLYNALGVTLKGNVAIKVHSGEVGNQNFLRPDFWQELIDTVGGTIVETNTAYDGRRNTTEKHIETMDVHGWNAHWNCEILDATGEDKILPCPYGKRIKQNFVGNAIDKYNSLLVLSHFKGHPMGGYGGALKQLSIGMASSYGKKNIHGSGDTVDYWNGDHDSFLESMADAAKSIVDYFGEKGGAVYINVMKNMSVDCDCCAVAEDPCMKDIGMLISLDPVAIDKACLDLVYQSDDPGKDHLIKRIESRNGAHTIDAAADLGIGVKDYELIKIN